MAMRAQMIDSDARRLVSPRDAAAAEQLRLALRDLRAFDTNQSTRDQAHVLRREVIEASVALEQLQRR
jgi:hypothetical protein